jgi:hypothetical protein
MLLHEVVSLSITSPEREKERKREREKERKREREKERKREREKERNKIIGFESIDKIMCKRTYSSLKKEERL